jgi:hypothetical protein
MQLLMGNPASGDDYYEWRYQGLTEESVDRKVEAISSAKRALVRELYVGKNALMRLPKSIAMFPNLEEWALYVYLLFFLFYFLLDWMLEVPVCLPSPLILVF